MSESVRFVIDEHHPRAGQTVVLAGVAFIAGVATVPAAIAPAIAPQLVEYYAIAPEGSPEAAEIAERYAALADETAKVREDAIEHERVMQEAEDATRVAEQAKIDASQVEAAEKERKLLADIARREQEVAESKAAFQKAEQDRRDAETAKKSGRKAAPEAAPASSSDEAK